MLSSDSWAGVATGEQYRNLTRTCPEVRSWKTRWGSEPGGQQPCAGACRRSVGRTGARRYRDQHAVPGVVAAIQASLGKDRLCIGKGRDPATVLQKSIPADVVEVAMGTEHIIDRLRRDTGVLRAVKKWQIQLVELRRERAMLVIACTAINQDRMPFGPHDPGVNADDDFRFGFVVVFRDHPSPMLFEQGRIPSWKKKGWREQ